MVGHTGSGLVMVQPIAKSPADGREDSPKRVSCQPFQRLHLPLEDVSSCILDIPDGKCHPCRREAKSRSGCHFWGQSLVFTEPCFAPAESRCKPTWHCPIKPCSVVGSLPTSAMCMECGQRQLNWCRQQEMPVTQASLANKPASQQAPPIEVVQAMVVLDQLF